MSRQPLSSFIRSYVERHSEVVVSTPEDEIDQFKSDLDELYGSVETWLSEAMKAGDVRVSREFVEITEATAGAYEMDRLRIEIGTSAVMEITPVGRFIVGAKGRADLTLVGSTEPSYRLVLLSDETGHSRWMMTSRPRGMAPTVLDQACFESAFRALLEVEPLNPARSGAGF